MDVPGRYHDKSAEKCASADRVGGRAFRTVRALSDPEQRGQRTPAVNGLDIRMKWQGRVARPSDGNGAVPVSA